MGSLYLFIAQSHASCYTKCTTIVMSTAMNTYVYAVSEHLILLGIIFERNRYFYIEAFHILINIVLVSLCICQHLFFLFDLGGVAHAFKLSTWEAQAGGTQGGQLGWKTRSDS